MKGKKDYEKWLLKHIEGWNNSKKKDIINIIFKSGKAEEIELKYFPKEDLNKFTKEELVLALIDKKYGDN